MAPQPPKWRAERLRDHRPDAIGRSKPNRKFRHKVLVDDISTIEGIIIQRRGWDDPVLPLRSGELRTGIFEIERSIPFRRNSRTPVWFHLMPEPSARFHSRAPSEQPSLDLFRGAVLVMF